MATPIVGAQDTASDSVIAGYFNSGEDAHRAINALLDEGFLPSQIGAAFHTGSTADARSAGTNEEVLSSADTRLREGATSIATGAANSGATSDTTPVQPNIIGAGAGTPFDGAGRPGPITGSDLTHTGLPSELKHELPHDAAGDTPTPQLASNVQTHSAREAAPTHPTGGSWTSKLKHLFEPKHEGRRTESVVEETRQDFGTGEGQLDLVHRYNYSPTAFESSATSAGVSAESSHYLSQRLSRGGAIVTVSVTGRTIEVEKIFERHNGIVRFEGTSFDDGDTLPGDSSVEVFGHLHQHYPTR